MPPPVPYQTPFAQSAPKDSAQRVFDTVIGPNVRLKDNLIQLACVIVGGAAGAGVGYYLGGPAGIAIGIIAGLVLALLLSGAVIGIVRLVTGARR
jgi:hypothetical protein